MVGKIEKSACEAGIEEPTLPRKRRARKDYDGNNTTGILPATLQDYYRNIYFESLDSVTGCITRGFSNRVIVFTAN